MDKISGVDEVAVVVAEVAVVRKISFLIKGSID